MHKNEFIRQIAKESGLPQTVVAQVLGSAVRVVARSLIAGQKVVWTGFGTFEMRTRSKRQGINPQTRQRIVIGATQTPGFTASSTFKERVLEQEQGDNGAAAPARPARPPSTARASALDAALLAGATDDSASPITDGNV
jgi:DNA-binding protein HU-beta